MQDQPLQDSHDQIEDLVVLAARNADVEVLNLGACELRKRDGELTGDHTYALAGGERLELATGDVIRIRRNDYRTRRGGDVDVDVLNGYRGQVTYVAKGGVAVDWRRPADDGGHTIERAWITADQIADGTLQHGYAMTIAAAQGLTCDYTLAYGVGASANDLYPAISRARSTTRGHRIRSLAIPVHVPLTAPPAPPDTGQTSSPGYRGERGVVLRRGLAHDH
ncbi:hypothetical protein [Streptomyces sp. NPDC091027]|uniref:hypothetical protein n=1 Tax=Streptomyces sp. NPDC091027 TaxID=3365971 RepID=UPI00382FCC76